MAYFIDLFSPETYEAFSRSPRDISGFRLRHKNRADKVKTGDVLDFSIGIKAEQAAAHADPNLFLRIHGEGIDILSLQLVHRKLNRFSISHIKLEYGMAGHQRHFW